MRPFASFAACVCISVAAVFEKTLRGRTRYHLYRTRIKCKYRWVMIKNVPSERSEPPRNHSRRDKKVVAPRRKTKSRSTRSKSRRRVSLRQQRERRVGMRRAGHEEDASRKEPLARRGGSFGKSHRSPSEQTSDGATRAGRNSRPAISRRLLLLPTHTHTLFAPMRGY